jgi:threonine synthase
MKFRSHTKGNIADTLCFDFPVVEVEKAFIPLNYSMGPNGFQGRRSRFMSRCLAYFRQNESKTQFLWLLLEILVVLSPAFWALRGRSNHSLSIRKGEYSRKQLTTLGQNIKALEVDGVLMIVRTW